jgi:hypothetical protein
MPADIFSGDRHPGRHRHLAIHRSQDVGDS